MSKIKIYVPPEFIDSLVDGAGPSGTNIDIEHLCISKIDRNSNGSQLTLVGYSGTRYYTLNGLWSEVFNTYTFNTVNNSTTAPTRCYNESQASPVFTGANYYDNLEYTTSYYYHPRFDSILVMFFIIVLVCIYFPYKIFSRAFGRWLKI